MKKLISSILLVATALPTFAQVSGTVFRDFNANGAKDNSAIFNEIGISGTVVTAYDAAGAVIASYTCTATGTYNIPASGTAYDGTMGSNTGFVAASTAVRLEFTSIPALYHATTGGSTVRFVAAPATVIDLGINYPNDYAQAVPKLITNRYVSGNPLGGGSTGTTSALVDFAYSNSGIGTTDMVPWGQPADAAVAVSAGLGSQVGATWGLAYQKSKKMLFASAFIKRHEGVGPLGEGGIYKIDYTSGTGVASSFVDVNTIGINVGTVGTGATPALRNTSRGLNANKLLATSAVADVVAYDAVGKKGIGGLEISDDETTLWFINLNNQTLNSIVIDSDNNAATAPTADDVQTFTLPANPCSAGTLRPFALKYYQGKVYVGAVCDGALEAFIYSFDGTTFTPILVNGSAAISLVYDKGQTTISGNCAPAANDGWFNWTTTPPVACDGNGTANALYAHPVPMFGDIEIDVDGSIIASFLDRTGHQHSPGNTQYDGSGLENIHSGGDILRICKVGGAYFMQGSAGGCANNAANTQGPNGGEFYPNDYIDYGGVLHSETTVGGLAMQRGKGEVALTVFDPFGSIFLTGGVNWFNNTTGAVRNPGYTLYFGTQDPALYQTGNFAKAAGLGDLELLSDPAPIEIGNRVWSDNNNNGVQDANEAGIANVSLQLFADFNNDGVADGAALGTTITSAVAGNTLGTWAFNATNVTDGDPTVAGNQAGVQPNKLYLVRVAAADWTAGAGVVDLLNKKLSTTDADATANGDLRDSDAILVSSTPQISVLVGTAGQNNHTLDMGFVPFATVGNYVWFDTDNNGLSNEAIATAGFNGATVELWSTGADNAIGGSDDVLEQTTTTANSGANPGFYNFTVYTSGNYYIHFPTVIGQRSITTQTTTAATDGNSDANAVTGNSPVFALNTTGTGTALNNPTIDAGYKCNLVPTITGAPVVCNGANATLTATGGGTYAWTGGQTTATVTKAAGTYTVTVTNSGCTGTASVVVTTATATAAIAGTTTTCNAATTTLTASGGTSYTWSSGETTAAIAQNVGVFTVTVTNAGCTNTASKTVTNTTVNATLTGATTTCNGATTTLTATGGGTYAFSGGTVSGATTTVTAGTYTVTVTNNGCTSTASITITNTNVIAAIAGTTITCNGATTTLTATGGGTYAWSSGETTDVMTQAAGIYTVTVTNNGCTSTASVTITVVAGSVGNYVWNDGNSDGSQIGETTNGINGITVQLWSAGADNTIGGIDDIQIGADAITANDGSGNAGYYNFVVCASGNYYIKFPTTSGALALTTQNTAAGTDGNSDADAGTGNSPVFAIDINGTGTAKDNPTIDAGYTCPNGCIPMTITKVK